MSHPDDRIGRLLVLILKTGVTAGTVVLVGGLLLMGPARAWAVAVVTAGVGLILTLPVIQAGVLVVSYRRAGLKRFTRLALALLGVQLTAVIVAFA